MTGSRRKYFWLVAADPETHKPYLIYGGDTEDAARQKGLELLAGLDFAIKAYPTRNLDAARSFLYGDRLGSTHSLSKSSERQGHDKSLRRLRKKIRGGF